jgi:hypothetical protein
MSSLLALSFMAGAVHVIAPDHWMPLSLLGWQKSWREGRLALLAAAGCCAHVLAGFILFLCMPPYIARLGARGFLWAAIAFVVVCGGLRSFRFQRIAETLRCKKDGGRALIAPLLLLGPAESLVPICFKAATAGNGYAGVLLAFMVGTFVSSVFLLSYGRITWNEPLKLVRNVSWTARGVVAALPAMVVVLAGIVLITRLR